MHAGWVCIPEWVWGIGCRVGRYAGMHAGWVCIPEWV